MVLLNETLLSELRNASEPGSAEVAAYIQQHKIQYYHIADVVIVGSGPIAATYARIIQENRQDASIIMVEAGSQENAVIGAHHKNAIRYQKNPEAFVPYITASVEPVSVPPSDPYIATLPSICWTPPNDNVFLHKWQNPSQVRERNLPAAGISRTVGGMASHWTCACPSPDVKELVQNPLAAGPGGTARFQELLKRARAYLNVHSDQFEPSIRNDIVKDVLVKALGRDSIINTPLAAERTTGKGEGNDFLTWSGVDTILGPNVRFIASNIRARNYALSTGYDPSHRSRTTPGSDMDSIPAQNSERAPESRDEEEYLARIGVGNLPGSGIDLTRLLNKYKRQYRLFTEAIAVFLLRDSAGVVLGAEVHDLSKGGVGSGVKGFVHARKAVVLACGAVGTPQLLQKSGFSPTAGSWLSEQTMTFCQVALKRSIIDSINKNDPRVRAHRARHPTDPLPIPFDDPEPQLYLNYKQENGYIALIDRGAFFTTVRPEIDQRVVVDLRFYGRNDTIKSNCVTFDDKLTDRFGMPQPTFDFTKSAADSERENKMVRDMAYVASLLGGFIPGSEPKIMPMGLALHITGTTRIGNDPKTSIANPESRVHRTRNLWIGGNGCIPDSTACNPTLTSVAIAIHGAEDLVKCLPPSDPKAKYPASSWGSILDGRE